MQIKKEKKKEMEFACRLSIFQGYVFRDMYFFFFAIILCNTFRKSWFARMSYHWDMLWVLCDIFKEGGCL